MDPSRTMKYKALFLLVTFSLNTVIGFACSLGVDMGFNSDHHSNNRGQQHEHSDAANHHEHDDNNSDSHQHETKSHHHSDTENNTESFSSHSEDNCCKDFVIGFQSLDKLLANQNNAQQKITDLSPFIIVLIAEATNTKGFVLHLRIPPKEVDYSPPDIRVFIQSFLI